MKPNEVKGPAEDGFDAASPDGEFVGAGGRVHSARLPLESVAGVVPRDGAAEGVTLFVNGVGSTPKGVTRQLQLVADATGSKVVGLFNESEGLARDVLQSTGDTFNRGRNAAVDSLAAVIARRVESGLPTRLFAHSQGTVIVARALHLVSERMRADGHSRSEVEERLSAVRVETIGGGQMRYADGPRYTHYINRFDPVSLVTGWNPLFHPGKGAEVVKFSHFTWKPSPHDPAIYLKHYRRHDPA